MAITSYHVQNVLRNYHRKVIKRKMTGQSPVGGLLKGPMMTRNTQQQIDKQVATQIRRRLIMRTFEE
jgi:hypothetical protein